MKRNFKEEYKNYVNNDMPDLWSRIEPALKEKNIGKTTGKTGNSTSENEDGKEPEKEIKTINLQAGKRKNSWMKYASVAAGVLLCIVGIRIYQNAGIESSDANKMELTADCTTDEEISADDSIEESAEEHKEESAAADDYNMEDSAAGDEGEMTQSAPMDRQEMTASDEESRDTAPESAEAAESEGKDDVADSDTEDSAAGKDSQAVAGTEQADSMTDSGTSTENMEEMELYAFSEDGFLIDTEEMENQTIKKEKVEHAYIASSDKAPSKWQKRGYVSKYTFIASGRNYVVYVTEEQKKRLEQKLYDPSYVGAYTLYLFIQKEGEKESEGVFSEKETVRE